MWIQFPGVDALPAGAGGVRRLFWHASRGMHENLTNLNLDLSRYPERIAYSDPLEPSSAVLRALHRHHVPGVPFENLDVQLSVPLDTSIDAANDTVVRRQRGGGCYEQNGLFGAS